MSNLNQYYNLSHNKAITSLTEDLWSLTTKMRGHLNSNNYKRFFLTFLFYKYISDYWKEYAGEKNMKQVGQSSPLKNNIDSPRFIIPANAEFDSLKVAKELPGLGDKINKVFEKIESANNEKLNGIFSYLDFNDSRILGEGYLKDRLLSSLIESFEDTTFEPSKINNDITAECFDLLYERFSLQEGKGGEAIYTPAGIGELLAKLLQPKNDESIYDPSCGSGNLLIKLKLEVGGSTTGSELFGQEISKDAHAIAKMNMVIHGFDDANIGWGDSLNNPKFVQKTNSEDLQKFDIVVSNPPFSVTNWRKPDQVYNRFKWGMPPDNKGDYAFIQHILASTKEATGRAGVLVSHGVLFRGGPELNIRQRILEDNLLDAVIGLPGNLLSYSTIPVAILLFSKARSKSSNVLFIDATREFKQDKRRNVLTPEGIERIVSTYKEYKINPSNKSLAIKEGFSYICTIEELAANEYNLNINRYVHYPENEEKVDHEKLKSEIEKMDEDLSNIRKAIKQNLFDLGLQ